MKISKVSEGETPLLKQALDQAVQWLLEQQDSEGWWCGELETNVTMTAEHVLLLRFLNLSLERSRTCPAAAFPEPEPGAHQGWSHSAHTEQSAR